MLVSFSAASVLAAPSWGDKTPQPVETPPQNLKPEQFKWKGGAIPSGPIVVVVSLTEQRAYVYLNGVRIGASSVSTGKPGHGTPTGVFTVLEKDADHRSKTYNNAPMPYTHRLTWSGVALHAGGLPGYPSSHGCVHLPTEFARHLFAVSPKGMTVVIADRGETRPRSCTRRPGPGGCPHRQAGEVPRLSAASRSLATGGAPTGPCPSS